MASALAFALDGFGFPPLPCFFNQRCLEMQNSYCDDGVDFRQPGRQLETSGYFRMLIEYDD